VRCLYGDGGEYFNLLTCDTCGLVGVCRRFGGTVQQYSSSLSRSLVQYVSLERRYPHAYQTTLTQKAAGIAHFPTWPILVIGIQDHILI
jgi:hypothetical protein